MSQKLNKAAFETAETYLARNAQTHQSYTNLRVDTDAIAAAKIFWWAGNIPLVEVPIVSSFGKMPSGYLLVSTSKELPPILEMCLEGTLLSQKITEHVHRALWADRITASVSRFVFVTSTELYVEIEAKDSSSLHLLKVPECRGVDIARPIKLEKAPADVFDDNVIREQWDILTPHPPPDVPEIILSNAAPVLYQQNCDGYGLECKIDIRTAQTYCSPHCIAGCVPVGWAMLLSSWKRSGPWDAAKIWPASTCWSTDWSSGNGPWVNACDQVNSTIWRLHALMGTTCDGSTDNNRTIDGAGIFHDFGMGWQYASRSNQAFDFLRSLTLAGQPFLYTAQAHWNIERNILASGPQPGDEGHAIVVFGNRSTDRMLYVALGWGSSFPYKWINFDQYNRVNSAFYLTAH
jgi:hypothetical protein